MEALVAQVQSWQAEQWLNKEDEDSQAEETVGDVGSDELPLVLGVILVPLTNKDWLDDVSSEQHAENQEDQATILLSEAWWLSWHHNLVWNWGSLWYILLETVQWGITDGRLTHVMHGVVTLVDWLTEQEEVIRVGSEQESADLTITIHIPNVVRWLNNQVVFTEHHLHGLEHVSLCAVNEDGTLLDSVLSSVASSSNDTLNNWLKKEWWHHNVRRTGIEDSVWRSLDSVGELIIELDSLNESRPEEVIVKTESDSGLIVDLPALNSVSIWLTEVNESLFVISEAKETE